MKSPLSVSLSTLYLIIASLKYLEDLHNLLFLLKYLSDIIGIPEHKISKKVNKYRFQFAWLCILL